MNPWAGLTRPLPDWFRDAKLGIFVHWGPYSVPAWAEPTGELGAVDEATWFRHNPYAEWYANTIRIPDSPAREHHRRTHGDAPYDDFLDAWRAEAFDPAGWARLFARAGARYVIPTTKHHDGVTLWDAPGTATRNTAHRGPRRDLVGAIATAARDAGLRFGVYYSGGLDWGVTDLPPLDSFAAVTARRPTDAAYAAYAYLHVRDLIDRYRPDVLWNDIEWPDAGKHGHALGLAELFRHFYATVPDGVVNDRWGDTHRDFRTSEYQLNLAHEAGEAWQNTRGIGLSFGYNRLEDERHLLAGPALVRHLADVVSRGGNLLLNVGPTAAGTIPDPQLRSLHELADWMSAHQTAIHGTRPLDRAVAAPSDDPWVRWTGHAGTAYALIDAGGRAPITASSDALALDTAQLLDGTPIGTEPSGGTVLVRLPDRPAAGPAVVRFRRR
ncbi:MAG TPA: alpha-L-fucosidase [Actinoplanes sp.]|nr:alpha-L-fucosidase [Actinoplanes sp.]